MLGFLDIFEKRKYDTHQKQGEQIEQRGKRS